MKRLKLRSIQENLKVECGIYEAVSPYGRVIYRRTESVRGLISNPFLNLLSYQFVS